MTDNVLERVRLAIAGAFGGGEEPIRVFEPQFDEAARAAIEALRELPLDVVEAGATIETTIQSKGRGMSGAVGSRAADVFTAMIDKILESK